MGALGLAILTLLGGTMLGYLARFSEFRRERRLIAYGDFVGTFLEAAHSGTVLLSLYMQFGDTMFEAERREEMQPWWREFGDRNEAFEAATARLRLIGTEGTRRRAEALEEFIAANILRVPPLHRTRDTEGWGEAAKVGPAKVESEAALLARKFADETYNELASWLARR